MIDQILGMTILILALLGLTDIIFGIVETVKLHIENHYRRKIRKEEREHEQQT